MIICQKRKESECKTRALERRKGNCEHPTQTRKSEDMNMLAVRHTAYCIVSIARILEVPSHLLEALVHWLDRKVVNCSWTRGRG